MKDKTILNITNGDTLTDRLLDFGYKGDMLVWSEMLCEGPTNEFIGSDDYIQTRKQFFLDCYDVIFEDKKFTKDLEKLDNLDDYSEVVIWFEFDLFCHINMLAVLSLLIQKKLNIPVYLVSSGYTKKDHTLRGLSELSEIELEEHYKDRIKLGPEDLDLGKTLWKIYCGKDHNLFKPYITQNSSFKYLNNCLKAHLTRFPNSKSGLDVIETNILKIIRDNRIKSQHHLLGYILNYQGFYGYGDLQLNRIIERMHPLYKISEDGIQLNELGERALNSEMNMSAVVNNNIAYGGIQRLDYQYSEEKNRLIKPKFNGNTSI